MGNVISTAYSDTHSSSQQTSIQDKPHSLSNSTASSSQDSQDRGDATTKQVGPRRRRESSESTASSHTSTLDTTESRRAEGSRTESESRSGNKALSLVSSMLSWFTSCSRGIGSDSAEQLDDGYDLRFLVEQRHRAFWELVQRILELNDVVLMIRMLLDFLQDDLGASVAAVFLVDQNSQSMSRIMRGMPTESGMAPSRGLVGEALRSRVARVLVNFNAEDSYDPKVDLAQEFQGQTLFCVPLIENDAVYAIIQAATAKPTRRVLDELHVKLLTWLGPILSSCMRKCIEFHDVLLSERTQKALLHIISSSDTEDTVLNLVDGVIDGACHITKAERVSLFMVDWETEELWSLSSSYCDETLRIPLRSSMLGLAATTQQTLNVRNPHTDHRYNWMTDQRRGVDTECVLYVPVGVQDFSQVNNEAAGNGISRPVAVLEIINKMEAEVPGGMTGSSCCGGFTFDDECAFEAFASEVAVILRRRSNEIEYIKLLADTRAEQVLAKRARSKVNLLECYTSYASSGRAAHPESCLRNSFVSSDKHIADCLECAATAKNDALVEEIAPLKPDATLKCGADPPCALVDAGRLNRAVGGAKHQSGRLGYEFVSSEADIRSGLVFSAPPGSRFSSWDFNVFAVDPATLPKLLEEMYLDFKVDEVLRTTKHRLQNFIVAMKEHYHPNPFHNFLHAFSVVHASYLLLSTTDAAQMLQPLDIAACLVASLGHDVDHPGHTNDFEVVSGSQLAMLYSDESVLEHHHAYTTFRLISKEKNANILQNLSRADYRHVRKMVVTAILGTDMANHFKFLESLEKVLRPASHHVDTSTISTTKRDNSNVTSIVAAGNGVSTTTDGISAKVQAGQAKGPEILSVLREAVFQTEGPVVDTPRSGTSVSAPSSFHVNTGPKWMPGRTSSGRLTKNGWVYNGTVEDRLFLVKTLVHASDLSGQVFPKPVALKWSNMISKEFAYQALMEQAENIPISYRNIDDPLKMVEGQLFFAQKIVSPLWDLMHVMLPGLDHCMENLTANVAHYEQELKRLKDARFEEGISADAMRQEREQQLEREEADLNEQQQSRRTRRDSMCSEDEGVAVPGLARHNPAKFNSFRTIPEDDSNSNSDEASEGVSPIKSSVIAAAEQSRKSPRSRSDSSSSSSSEELDEQSLVVYE
ncbi:Calcium/calmodulin-dependent 3',5'-cyclic nucleotide phosphodiesterase 1B [Phytophthora boehmeriae]|uniref:Phosphodiesterase n=1 Tax=Phytophthora boehmeriae TaxID=109152 RepID=A0A8T1X855_9STRA|nr:Calcium/calmodulin-dependent 3',5'-cyclic nucleotide phosphodiesterase 1B [Phytophthora boehmeriae]